jgi:hypothetical protein
VLIGTIIVVAAFFCPQTLEQKFISEKSIPLEKMQLAIRLVLVSQVLHFVLLTICHWTNFSVVSSISGATLRKDCNSLPPTLVVAKWLIPFRTAIFVGFQGKNDRML